MSLEGNKYRSPHPQSSFVRKNRIPGKEEPDRLVILGNHRDAWDFGGGDPSLGTAVMLELTRGFGYLLSTGWQPRRTILFCNWDAEEYALVGSEEYVELHEQVLRQQVCYCVVCVCVCVWGGGVTMLTINVGGCVFKCGCSSTVGR